MRQSRGNAGLTAAAVDPRCPVEVSRHVELIQAESLQKAAQIRFVAVATRSCEHFHDDRPPGQMPQFWYRFSTGSRTLPVIA
jgi:hypothetical protein